MNVQVENLLKLKKIYHYYGKAKVLEEFNLKIENKSLNAVIGPNGVGKSTVLRLISGLESPDRGKIVFQGERIDGLKAYKITKKGISQSPDRRRLFYQLSVADNLRMGAYILKDKQQYKALRDLFSIFKLNSSSTFAFP
ncbi:MAG TPA: ATP-binding cassette domain-containing protein [bacterium]|nr:ATP-binding cassette domain-containing protein [bacterium]